MTTPRKWNKKEPNSTYSHIWEHDRGKTYIRIKADTKTVLYYSRGGATGSKSKTIGSRIGNEKLARELAVAWMKKNPRGKTPAISLKQVKRNGRKVWVLLPRKSSYDLEDIPRTTNLYHVDSANYAYEYWFRDKNRAIKFYKRRF